MSSPSLAAAETTSDAIRAALEPALRRRFGAERSIAQLVRRPSPYRSSFRLEELDVTLDDGTLVPLMFKETSRAALSDDARAAKPEFLLDARREVIVYRWILGPERLGTPALYEAAGDAGRHWLFIERVAGAELHQVGDLDTWAAVARWLATMHTRFAPRAPGLAGPPLLFYGKQFHAIWIDRAATFAESARDEVRRAQIEFIAPRHAAAVERVIALPRTFIHGEFYASNVLVQRYGGPTDVRVAPVDWEMAGIGPGLLDLASLAAGRWTDQERSALVSAYYDALGPEYRIDTDALAASLDSCRLLMAVQWLGWSQSWSPPAHRAHDWLGEAVELAQGLAP